MPVLGGLNLHCCNSCLYRRACTVLQVYRDAALAGSQDAATFFPCRAWFDKELGMTKELFPMRRDLDMAKASNSARMQSKALAIHVLPGKAPVAVDVGCIVLRVLLLYSAIPPSLIPSSPSHRPCTSCVC